MRDRILHKILIADQSFRINLLIKKVIKGNPLDEHGNFND